jgi:hypothetical protein
MSGVDGPLFSASTGAMTLLILLNILPTLQVGDELVELCRTINACAQRLTHGDQDGLGIAAHEP